MIINYPTVFESTAYLDYSTSIRVSTATCSSTLIHCDIDIFFNQFFCTSRLSSDLYNCIKTDKNSRKLYENDRKNNKISYLY